MSLPSSVSCAELARIKGIVIRIHGLLRECNPYVQDFMTVVDMHRANPDEMRNMVLVINADERPAGEHARRYKAPEGLKEVSVLLDDDNGHKEVLRDIVVHLQGGGINTISDTHRSYDALHMPTVFVKGEDCWRIGMSLRDRDVPGRTKLTCAQYYAYHLHLHVGKLDILFRTARLFQEWLCMAALKIESGRLNWVLFNQSTIRAELYNNAADAVSAADGSRIGQKVILPSTFIGSPRAMHARYQDAMAIVRVKGKPDLFITVTCNPNWPEIVRELLPGQVAADRSELTADVFELKLRQILKEINEIGIFGRKVAVMDVIEFQKRGLPHAHLLLILAPEDKFKTADDIDAAVSAEIPEDPVLQEKVVRCGMLHNLCGTDNPGAPCMKDGKCSKGFPKDYQLSTEMAEDAMPLYSSRSPADGGLTVSLPNGKKFDN
jgi:hypothetical protein